MKRIIALLIALVIAASMPTVLTYADFEENGKERIKRALEEMQAEEQENNYQNSEPSEYEISLRQAQIEESIETLKKSGYFDSLTYQYIPEIGRAHV